MKITFGKTVIIDGVPVSKLRGQKQGQVMRDRSKYSRKKKHKRRKDIE